MTSRSLSRLRPIIYTDWYDIHSLTPPSACSTTPPAASTTACDAHVSHSLPHTQEPHPPETVMVDSLLDLLSFHFAGHSPCRRQTRVCQVTETSWAAESTQSHKSQRNF